MMAAGVRTRSAGRGVALTEIGFGAAQIGNLYRPVSDEEAHRTIDAAWESGIRYFDTAPHYGLGLSERRLGAALAARPRSDYVISTKVGRLLRPSPERAAAGIADEEGFAVPATSVREWRFDRDGIRRSIDDSLARLGTDYIDIAYLHDPDDHWDAASSSGIAALLELREEGIVRAVGAGMNQAAMPARFIRECDVDVLMIAGRYTLLDRAAEEELLPAARERGVSIVAAGIYNSGLLSAASVDSAALFDYQVASEHMRSRAEALAEICTAHGVELPDAAVQFALREPVVASVVVGCRTPAHVRSTLDRYSARLDDALWRELDDAVRAFA